MQPAAASLREFVDEWDMTNDDVHMYVNRVTGELISATTEYLEKVESEDETDDDSEPGWEAALLEDIRDVLDSPDWIPVPQRTSHEDHAVMADFSAALAGEKAKADLFNALKGAKAFRRFRDAVDRLGLSEEWHAFRRQALAREAALWLEAKGIPQRP